MAEIVKSRRLKRHAAPTARPGSAATTGQTRTGASSRLAGRQTRRRSPRRRERRSAWGPLIGMGAASAAVTFLASFSIPPRYEAKSRVLVRSRDATVLSSTGNDLASQPGIVDSTLGASLVNTQIAVLGSHTIAEEIVNRLKLDQRPVPTGIVADIKGVVAGSIKRTRAYIMHGMYRQPGRRDEAIQEVAEGLSGAPVGESFVLEITGSGGSPTDAQQVTDTAADLLIETSAIRTNQEAEAHRLALQRQLNTAYDAQSEAEEAIAELKQRRSITNLDASLVLSETGLQELRSSLNETNAELEAVAAKLAATKTQLAATPKTTATTSEIQTGRSSTEVSSETTSSTYTTLLNASQSMEADLAGLRAKSGALTKILAITPPAAAALPAAEAALRMAELKRDVATSVVQSLSEDYEAAAARAQTGSVELTRLDSADLPIYPAAPKRWMYLFLGFTIGALAGFVTAYRRLVKAGAFRHNTRVLGNDWDAEDGLPFAQQPLQLPLAGTKRRAGTLATEGESDEALEAQTSEDSSAWDAIDLTEPSER